MRKSVIALLTLIFISGYQYSIWYANWPPTPPPNPGGDLASSFSPGSTVDAASYMLVSYSNFIILLNELEKGSKTGFDFDNANSITDKILQNLSAARGIYENIFHVYRESMIDDLTKEKFKKSDYDELVRVERLHPQVMDRVKLHLREGDVAGFFNGTMDDIHVIIQKLAPIKESIRKRITPKYEDLRQLYQNLTDSMLYGHYSSVVFYSTKN